MTYFPRRKGTEKINVITRSFDYRERARNSEILRAGVGVWDDSAF